MIPARHSNWFKAVFRLYMSFRIRQGFHRVELIDTFEDKGLPLLVIANHMSWWDGFWIWQLSNHVFKRKFHVLMLESQLRNNMFLRKLGAFSIRKNTKSALESIGYASNLMKDPGNLLLLFPQGKIQSQHIRPLRFQQGWLRIFESIENQVQVLFVANLVDYFSNPRPTLRQYFYSPDKTSDFDCMELEKEYNQFFENCIKQQPSL